MNGIKIEPEDLQVPLANVKMNGVERTSPMKVEEPEENLIWVVHVEVRLKPETSASHNSIKQNVRQFMAGSAATIYLPSTITGWENHHQLQGVEVIKVTESTCPVSSIAFEQAELEIHVYQPSGDSEIEEFTAGGSGKGEDNVMAASVLELPARDLDGLWDSLMYPDDIKPRLLNYIHATLLFSDRDVDSDLVTWNRLVLLHGPPGTGKTSLCRALAQKLSIRLLERYPVLKLVEINSHSLFSRWFSESGKLVQKLFAAVTEMVEEENTFVVLLIDEVESLTSARAGAMKGNEPSDALRVVNALLTQLDKLKHRKNVLIMTTSNLLDAIDTAFIDRADIVQYVGLPGQEGIYWILRSCFTELIRTGIVEHVTWLEPSQLANRLALATQRYMSGSRDIIASERLWEIAGKCGGMSGRTLRRLPVLAHARHIGVSSVGGRASSVDVWLNALARVVEEESSSRGTVTKATGL